MKFHVNLAYKSEIINKIWILGRWRDFSENIEIPIKNEGENKSNQQHKKVLCQIMLLLTKRRHLVLSYSDTTRILFYPIDILGFTNFQIQRKWNSDFFKKFEYIIHPNGICPLVKRLCILNIGCDNIFIRFYYSLYSTPCILMECVTIYSPTKV